MNEINKDISLTNVEKKIFTDKVNSFFELYKGKEKGEFSFEIIKQIGNMKKEDDIWGIVTMKYMPDEVRKKGLKLVFSRIWNVINSGNMFTTCISKWKF